MEEAPGNSVTEGRGRGAAGFGVVSGGGQGSSKSSPANSVSRRGNSSWGMRAGAGGGALLGSCRWSRILVTTAGSERKASTRRRAAHFGHTRASTWSERLSWWAQEYRWRFGGCASAGGVAGILSVCGVSGTGAGETGSPVDPGGAGRSGRRRDRGDPKTGHLAKTPW